MMRFFSKVIFIFQSGRIGADEVINDDDGKDAEVLDELIKEKEAKTQAILLEMVHFIPYTHTCRHHSL